MTPSRTPAGVRFTCDHELGCVTADSFLTFWRSFRDAYIDAIKKFCPDWFPMNVVESLLINVVKFFYELTWRGIFRMGISMGDKSYDMIFGRAEEEIDKLKGEFDRLLSDARSRLQSQISELQGLTDRFKNELGDLESAKNKAMASIEDLDARVRALEVQKLGKIKVPRVEELLKIG